MTTASAARIVSRADPHIHYHGRWDTSPATWWAGSGFKLYAKGLSSLALNLGPLTSSPSVAAGISINYGEFVTVNLTAGENVIPVPHGTSHTSSVIRINVEGWQSNRLELQNLTVNTGAELLEYKQSPLKFQFIGDSLSAGQYDARGVDDSWGFLVAEQLKAEYQINAQPGACLTDQLCWGNHRGVSHQFFKTEDTQYYYDAQHNYTTDWDFSKEVPKPTHVVIAIGANDNSYEISQDAFTATLTAFVDRLRVVYPNAVIFLLSPWGWPSEDGSVSYYYEGAYQDVITKRNAVFDSNIHLINGTGWLSYGDVFPDNQHPTPEGHAKIAAKFLSALEGFGISSVPSWPSQL